MRFMLGIDVGGTFTDFVAYDRDTSAIEVWKHLSVPADPVVGILAGAGRIAEPRAIGNIRLGTTVATNAVLERKGAGRRLRHDPGFRDVPFIQRGNRKSHYDMSWVKPKPLVKRRHCFELDERIDALRPGRHAAGRGRGCAPSPAAIRGCRRDPGGRRLLLFSYLNPAHERRAGRSWPRSCPTCRSRSPTRCCRSGRSTSAPPPPSPTPT